MQPLRVVLLGGTGFVGSAILRRLETIPGITVRALLRGDARRLPSTIASHVAGELPTVPRGLFPEEPHVLLHFATKQIDCDRSGFDVNVASMRALTRALPPSCLGVVYGSSISVYGQGPQRGNDETLAVSPATPLARSRARAEQVMFEAARARGISAFALRPRFVVGAGDAATIPRILAMAARRMRVGSGKQEFTIVDVDDYAEIVVDLARKIVSRAAASEPRRTPLHVGYARRVSLDEICAALATRFDLAPPRLRIPAPPPVTRLLARLPAARARAIAVRLELIGQPHFVDVRRLSSEIGGAVVERDPRAVLERAAHAMSREAHP